MAALREPPLQQKFSAASTPTTTPHTTPHTTPNTTPHTTVEGQSRNVTGRHGLNNVKCRRTKGSKRNLKQFIEVQVLTIVLLYSGAGIDFMHNGQTELLIGTGDTIIRPVA